MSVDVDLNLNLNATWIGDKERGALCDGGSTRAVRWKLARTMELVAETIHQSGIDLLEGTIAMSTITDPSLAITPTVAFPFTFTSWSMSTSTLHRCRD